LRVLAGGGGRRDAGLAPRRPAGAAGVRDRPGAAGPRAHRGPRPGLVRLRERPARGGHEGRRRPRAGARAGAGGRRRGGGGPDAALTALALASLVVLAATPDRHFEGLIPRRSIDVAAALAARNPALRVLGDDWSGTPMLWLHPAMSGRVGFDVRLEQYSNR